MNLLDLESPRAIARLLAMTTFQTGGAHVSAFQTLPIPYDPQHLLERK